MPLAVVPLALSLSIPFLVSWSGSRRTRRNSRRQLTSRAHKLSAKYQWDPPRLTQHPAPQRTRLRGGSTDIVSLQARRHRVCLRSQLSRQPLR